MTLRYTGHIYRFVPALTLTNAKQLRIYYSNANEDRSIEVLIRREADGVIDSIRRVVTNGEVFFGYELEELRTALLERGYVDLEPGAADVVSASQAVASQSNRRL